MPWNMIRALSRATAPDSDGYREPLGPPPGGPGMLARYVRTVAR